MSYSLTTFCPLCACLGYGGENDTSFFFFFGRIRDCFRVSLLTPFGGFTFRVSFLFNYLFCIGRILFSGMLCGACTVIVTAVRVCNASRNFGDVTSRMTIVNVHINKKSSGFIRPHFDDRAIRAFALSGFTANINGRAFTFLYRSTGCGVTCCNARGNVARGLWSFIICSSAFFLCK